MAVEIKIPKLGLTMKEATVAQWLIKAGNPVAEKQIVCVIETDKVTFEVPAPASGLVYPIASPGQRFAVGEVIGYIAVDEIELKVLERSAGRQSDQAAGGPRKPGARRAKESPCRPVTGIRPAAVASSPRLSPENWRLNGVLSCIPFPAADPEGGSCWRMWNGPWRLSAKSRLKGMMISGQSPLLTAAQEIPIRGIRKIISENMMLSLTTQAQLTLHTEASAIHLRDLRSAFNDPLRGEAPPVSYNAIIVKAAALALRRYPLLNASVDGQDIKIWEQIHIGVAMDFGDGLLVPKIRNADTKSVRVISAELDELAEKAAGRRLLPDDLQAGTFTITNLGSSDIDHFTPIINPPESAILGVGRIIEKPWVREGLVVAEPRLALSLTFDHRIIDGALAGQFLKTIKDNLEETRLLV